MMSRYNGNQNMFFSDKITFISVYVMSPPHISFPDMCGDLLVFIKMLTIKIFVV